MTNATNKARYLIDDVSVFCAFDKIIECAKLKENPRNPNTHPQEQIELLAEIIKKTGWRAPITVSNLSGFIVKGHGRLQAAKAAGLKQCPVEYQNFKDEEEELAALLADNKLAELAEIDTEKLMELFKDYEFEEVALTGFSDAEIKAIIDGVEDIIKMEECETDMPELASGEKAPFQQITFTLADAQAEVIKSAIAEIKKTEQYKYIQTFGNENSNGNALYCIIERFING